MNIKERTCQWQKDKSIFFLSKCERSKWINNKEFLIGLWILFDIIKVYLEFCSFCGPQIKFFHFSPKKFPFFQILKMSVFLHNNVHTKISSCSQPKIQTNKSNVYNWESFSVSLPFSYQSGMFGECKSVTFLCYCCCYCCSYCFYFKQDVEFS